MPSRVEVDWDEDVRQAETELAQATPASSAPSPDSTGRVKPLLRGPAAFVLGAVAGLLVPAMLLLPAYPLSSLPRLDYIPAYALCNLAVLALFGWDARRTGTWAFVAGYVPAAVLAFAVIASFVQMLASWE